MTTFNTFDILGEHLAEKVHKFDTDQFVVALCSAANAPSVSADLLLADIVEISYTNLSSRNLATSSSSSSGGLYKLVLADLVLTASGTVATFRYVVVYNDTPTSPADPLIGYYDHGSDVSLLNGQTYTIDFNPTNGLIQIQT